MYPNFMRNMSPQDYQNNLNMMNPEMMKNASNMIAGMSDSQLQMYLAQMGMTGMDPTVFRNMCQNMSNMSDSQLNNMKNMAQTNYQNMNMNNNVNSDSYKDTIVSKTTKMKEEGNSFFRNGNYEAAIKKYYETIEEIKTTNDKNKNDYKKELENIERICRLNIANCKLKTEDYDGVINECSIVLETDKCFKAYYRMGLALFNKEKYDKAYRYLDNAYAIGTSSEKQVVEPYLKKCKDKEKEIKNKEKKNKEEKNEIKNENIKKNEQNNNTNKFNEESKNSEEDKNKENENNEENKTSDNNKLNSIKESIEKEKLKNKQKKEKEKKSEEDDDIKIETINEKKNNIDTSSSSTHGNSCNCCHSNNNINTNMPPPNLNQDYINQARNHINNMSDEQMNMMINQMKSMDNQTLKNMMAAQGMNLTDQQIEMMKMSMTPETMKMMRDPNFQVPQMNNINTATNNINTNNNNINTNNNQIPQMPQMPNLANMNMQEMMEYLRKNPDLLKMISPQLSKMFGGKDIDPEIMMKSMEKIMWIFSIPGKIKKFFCSWRGICFIVFIVAIFYGIFKRK